jgi:hypothetical protein
MELIELAQLVWLAENKNIGADLADRFHIERLREELTEEAVTGGDFIAEAARS